MGVWEKNEGLERRGYGLHHYIWRGGGAWLARSVCVMWGSLGASGWARETVESRRGVQKVPWSARDRGEGCCTLFLVLI
jgi:hypothetical protein